MADRGLRGFSVVEVSAEEAADLEAEALAVSAGVLPAAAVPLEVGSAQFLCYGVPGGSCAEKI